MNILKTVLIAQREKTRVFKKGGREVSKKQEGVVRKCRGEGK